MSRPQFGDVNSSLMNWDATNRDNWNNVKLKPLAAHRIATGGLSAFSPSAYEECFASYETSPGVYVPIWSNGTNWINLITGATVT